MHVSGHQIWIDTPLGNDRASDGLFLDFHQYSEDCKP